jgi:hypothetical protein
MIQNRQCQMRLALLVRLYQQVTAPHAITSHGSWYAMLQLPPRCVDQILISANRVRDIGLTHCHLPLEFPAPIEGMGNRSTTHLRHHGLQPNNFLFYPCGFGLSEYSARL